MTVDFKEYAPKQGALYHEAAVTSVAAVHIPLPTPDKVIAVTATERIGYLLGDGTEADPLTNGIPLERFVERIRNVGNNSHISVIAQGADANVTVEELEDS